MPLIYGLMIGYGIQYQSFCATWCRFYGLPQWGLE